MCTFVIGAYLVCAILFILSLSGLRHQKTSKGGVVYGIIAMTLAIIATFFVDDFESNYLAFFIPFLIGGVIGAVMALQVEMINMPQMVAALHSFVGLAATLVSFSHYLLHNDQSVLEIIETNIGVFIGAITFTGSVVAYGKLNGNIRGEPLILFGWGRHVLNLVCILTCLALAIAYGVFDDVLTRAMILLGAAVVAGFLGWHLVMAIGGADMPVVVSMLNSYSGWATCASGFLLENELLIITGALVGSSGAILSYIMCEAMNRSFISVIAGGFGQGTQAAASGPIEGEQKEISKDSLVKLLQDSKRIVIVPGYGMAAAKCQHDIATLTTFLQKKGKKVQFCIHPVAGRLPGHMNVLLAEASVDYNIVKEMDEINSEFSQVDLVLIVGANDIVNPDALENPNSLIAGMPVCKVWESKKVIVFKRGKGTGYAGIENPLFFKPVTNMFYGDAAKSVQILLNAMTELGDNFGESAALTDDEEENQPEGKAIQQDFPDPVMTLGVPKETHPLEKRVAVTPKTVGQFRALGFKVLVESSAGEAATFTDEQYEEHGAYIVRSKEVWKSDVVIKVRKPENADHLSHTKCLICYVQPGSSSDWLQEVSSACPQLTCLAMDCVPRITKAQKLDSLSSMANIGGYRAVMEAFQYFQKCPKPMMTAAGKMPPAHVLVMGAGVAGLSAIGYCKSLGCIVKAIDSRAAAKSDAESMGAKFLQVKVKEDGGTSTGYAREMSDEYKAAQAEMIVNTAKNVDIIITTALIPGRPAPLLIPKHVVQVMKPGSVIVDMAAENGGNCELTVKDQVITTPNGVIIVGFTDLVSRMAPQTSELYANNLYHLLSDMGGGQNFKVNLDDEVIQAMCVVNDGQILWSPNKTLPAVSAKPKSDPITAEVIKPKQLPSCWSEFDYIFIAILLIVLFIGISFATFTSFMSLIMTFVLALFIGFMVIWSVSPALHTPLMSVTNAISGIIVVGAMLCLEPDEGNIDFGSVLGILSVLFASINIWGGFIVTYRMLQMFKTNLADEAAKH